MLSYPFFLDKLRKIESLSTVLNSKKIFKLYEDVPTRINCNKCQSTTYYKLANIIWPAKINHCIKSHQKYPSEYFTKVILNTNIIDGTIVNKPIMLDSSQIGNFHYIPVYYNKLLIIDALLKQGSQPRYEHNNQNRPTNFVYSEHSGAIAIKNNTVDNIIVYTDTNRIDPTDSKIFLPNNNTESKLYEYLFHTHPNTITYAGRIKEGILYEFPSANDIFNFIKYHREGKAQGSVVVAPEGIYVIRPLRYEAEIKEDPNLYTNLKNMILELEKKSIKKLDGSLSKLSDPDIFHQMVGANFEYIKRYNDFLESYNLYIEYYPREKKNNEWCLRPISLMYVAPN
jgi:hypothetical protein